MELIGFALLAVAYTFAMAFIGVFIIVIALALFNLVAVILPRWLKSLPNSPKRR